MVVMEATASLAEQWEPAPPPATHNPPERPDVGELLARTRREEEIPEGPEPDDDPPLPPAAIAPAPEEPRVRPSWARDLLALDGDAKALARRTAFGVGLAAIYGAALGAREGGLALLTHALGVPAALVAVGLVGLPSLYIVLALFDAPLSTERAAGAAVRGIASSGLVLAGLAPLAALYVVSSASAEAAGIAGTLGLILGGLLGLRHLVMTLREALEQADSATRVVATIAQLGFGLFAILLGWRVWTGLLPLVGGA